MTPDVALSRLRPWLIAAPAAGLLAGLVLRAVGHGDLSAGAFVAGTLPVLAALILDITLSLRRGEVGLDIVAALSMTAAMVFGETLAAVVVAAMYAGGNLLEAYAARRARREMSALLSRVPRTASRRTNGGLEEIALDAVNPGDILLIRRGDVAPVDGDVAEGVAILDQSALTGEAMPVRRAAGDPVMSGSSNAGDAYYLRATRLAAQSTYAGIVRLVEQAQASKAPMARLADRYALGFLGLTLVIAGAAWALSGDPIRAVAVLVIATPCPLILAVPVALTSGLSRAAKYGVLIKGAPALETMARIRAIVMDKTGTLTDGRPVLTDIVVSGDLDADEVLRLAASLDQASRHVMALAIVDAAHTRGLALSIPGDVLETAGDGVEGTVDGRAVILGGPGFVARRLGLPPDAAAAARRPPGAAAVAVAVDGAWAGELVLADRLRAGTRALIAALRAAGAERIILATGDRMDAAEAAVAGLGLDAVEAELTPARKVEIIIEARRHGPVMMIGDGINDAPALAAADIGVAMGARGAAASAEAADVVLLVDRLDRILPGIEIAQGARRIALQSVAAGIGLSVIGMIAAALGHITPVQGAVLQEVIDVAVILNALRVLGLRPAKAAP
ncbi:MAG: heavy metal translocating P-type ATPase [Paracoccaceae bacterium]|jgi:heavy metal translocating P-type ATPase